MTLAAPARCPHCGRRLDTKIPSGVRQLSNRATMGAQILRLLLRHPGESVSTDDLLYACYSGAREPQDPLNTLYVRILEMRRKLVPFGMDIENTYGGYRLVSR